MRDLTVEEIEMVSGGDGWGEVQQAMGNAWSSFWGLVKSLMPTTVPEPSSNEVQEMIAVCGVSGVQSVTMQQGGASIVVSGATKTATATVTGGALTIVCK